MEQRREIGWDKLDKTKFYTWGIGLFSGVTMCLYPLTVIKTQQIAGPAHLSGIKGLTPTVSNMWKSGGIRSFYKGFGTVCVGAIPIRVVYLSALEFLKGELNEFVHGLGFSDAVSSGVVNLMAGGLASMSSQLVYVPIDVVSQRLMVEKSDGKRSGLAMARCIIRHEGVRGLWKGFFASVGTHVPGSAIWWGSYGFYQKMVWKHLDQIKEVTFSEAMPTTGVYMSISEADALQKETQLFNKNLMEPLDSTKVTVAVQMSSALLAGITSASITTPLDVIKTTKQLHVFKKGSANQSSLSIVKQIMREQGLKGFTKGLVPRAANISLWATCMVSAYEFLKRVTTISD